MSILDATYGSFATMNGSRFYGTGGPDVVSKAADSLNPHTTVAPTRALAAPSRPIHDEPGAGKAAAFSPRTLLDNPATWLVLTLGFAIAAGHYAATGHVL